METMTSQATFLLDISLRCHSAVTMWDTMKILQNNLGVSIGGDGIQNGGIGIRGPGEATSGHDLPEEMSTSALHAQALQLVLINHGNTCYMNALIQVMVSCMTPGGIR